MKIQKFLIVIILFFASCTLSQEESITIKKIDHYDTSEENAQLGFYLLNYNFPKQLLSEFPDLSNEILQDIRWNYRLLNNNEVHFIITLSNEAIERKEDITKFFKETVETQITRQIVDYDIFMDAEKLSKRIINEIESGQHDLVWENSSHIFKQKSDREVLPNSSRNKRKLTEIGGDRKLFYKLYYETVEEFTETEFYIICFGFEKDKKMFEQFTFHFENDDLKLAGYDYRIPN